MILQGTTRFKVIDYRRRSKAPGLRLAITGVGQITLELQDAGRTLKVILADDPAE